MDVELKGYFYVLNVSILERLGSYLFIASCLVPVAVSRDGRSLPQVGFVSFPDPAMLKRALQERVVTVHGHKVSALARYRGMHGSSYKYSEIVTSWWRQVFVSEAQERRYPNPNPPESQGSRTVAGADAHQVAQRMGSQPQSQAVCAMHSYFRSARCL
jgi:hypothetical protein